MNPRVLLALAALVVILLLALLFWPDGPAPENQAASQGEDYADTLAEQHAEDEPVASEAAAEAPAVEISSETISYGAVNGQAFEGYLAQPAEAVGPLPAVLMYHEWWGLNDNIRSMADQLAAHGYLVLALDLFDGEVYERPEQARAAVAAALQDKARLAANIYAAHDFVKARQAPHVAALGWCFGGAMAFQNALLTPHGLDAAVIYYGQVGGSAEQLKPVDFPILAFFGGKDDSIPLAAVRRFEATMTELGKPLEVHVYEDAGHAFANPSGKNYRREDAAAAWAHTLDFLAQHLKPAPAEAAPPAAASGR